MVVHENISINAKIVVVEREVTSRSISGEDNSYLAGLYVMYVSPLDGEERIFFSRVKVPNRLIPYDIESQFYNMRYAMMKRITALLKKRGYNHPQISTITADAALPAGLVKNRREWKVPLVPLPAKVKVKYRKGHEAAELDWETTRRLLES